MPIIPPVWSWPPVHWPAGGDAPDEVEMPEDDFASVAPADLQAARDERDNPGEMQFPEDNFASVTPADREAFRAELAAEEAATAPQPEQPDPFAALRDPPDHPYYIGYPRNPDERPAPDAPPDAPPEALPEVLPAADAISGAGGTPITPLAPGLGIPQATFEQAMAQVPTETKGVPELPDEYLSDQEAGQAYAALSPEEQLNRQLDLETRRNDLQRRRIAEAAKADAEEAERDERDWRASREAARRDLEQIDAEAKAEAAREIDINRGWNEAGTGTKILGIFSALAGGLVAHQYGGRNSGLEMIDKLIDRDIDAQKFNKSQRVNDITRRSASARDRLQMAGDDFREETRLRLTAYDRVLGQIATEVQNYDPRGTQAIRYGQAYQDLAAKRSQLAVEAQKRTADAYKEQLDFASKELDLKKKQAELAKAQRAAMGGGGGGSSSGVKLTPDQWAAQYGEAGRPPGPKTEKEYKAWLADRGKLANATKAETEAAKAARENSPEHIAGQLGVADMVNEDGSPLLFRNEAAGERIAKLKASTDTIARLVDQITAARAKYGWSSDLAKSDEWRRIKSDNGALVIAVKTLAELGALSGPDMGLVEQMAGTSDPTELRDPTAGLSQLRSNAVLGFNEVVRSAARVGSKPKTYSVPSLPQAKPRESASDGEFKSAMAKPSITEAAQFGRTGREKVDGDVVLPRVRATIDNLTTVAKSGPSGERAAARLQLEKLFTDGPNPSVRRAAEAALLEIGRPAEVDGPRQATAKDGISQPVRR